MLKELIDHACSQYLAYFIRPELLLADIASQVGQRLCETPLRMNDILHLIICNLFDIDEVVAIVRIQNPVSDNFGDGYL